MSPAVVPAPWCGYYRPTTAHSADAVDAAAAAAAAATVLLSEFSVFNNTMPLCVCAGEGYLDFQPKDAIRARGTFRVVSILLRIV
jgi:hypothetical protein